MQNINYIIEDCDIKTAFRQIINFYDPNRAKNKKTKILDTTFFFSWVENDYSIFEVTKTRNLEGSVLNYKYDIILYEPPSNKAFFVDTLENIKIFDKIININGNIIVKLNNFILNDNGILELKGTYDIKDIFENYKFYLHNQIIYKNKIKSNYYNFNNDNKITHFYFMIFKKKFN